MSTLSELLAQKAALDAAIAAEKPSAVAQVKALMGTLGVTLQDLGAPAPAAAYRSKRPVKFRDAQGNTWTGVGQRPRWVRAALANGAALEQFAVGK